jgi:hypothetical protein
MDRMRTLVLRGAALAVVATLVVVAIASGRSDESSRVQAPAGAPARAVHVTFHEDEGVTNRRILNLGGLVVRASCVNSGTGSGRLEVAAKTYVENSSRALVLSQRRGGRAETYAFKSADFDPSFGWYDITGTDPYNTTGILSLARPDRGQVSLMFAADEGTSQYDCTFDGEAHYIP